jgi:DNA-3-methyladenine glycosylase II
VTTTLQLDAIGPYDLREIATMGFGHRDERSFDGVMRMAFRLDGDYEHAVGVAARQDGQTVELTVDADGPLSDAEVEAVRRQVARVISLDHDGEAFHRLCLADPALAPVHEKAPGFRPSNFTSPYEALIWSVISARRARPQGIALRTRIAEAHGTVLEVAGARTPAVPGPGALLAMDSFPGLPADRIPRLHAVAEAAMSGELDVERLQALPPEEAKEQLQRLPGIGPFYSALVVVRALGHADVLALEEPKAREAVRQRYGVDHELSDAELAEIAERWRPFRTWVTVMLRALGNR